jgi:uncharacterized delta-60 repeat protein
VLAAALVLTPFGISAAGDLDRTFGGDGTIVTDVGGDDYPSDVAVQRDGKIVVVGVSIQTIGSAFVIARYTASGALDRTFGDGGIVRPDFGGLGWGMAVATQADGKIVVAGHGTLPGGNFDFVLARYNVDGSLDASFDGDGRVFTDFGYGDGANGLAIQPDGKIVAVGLARSGSSRDTNEFAVARYNPNGSLDSSFDGDGRVLTAFTSLTDSAVDAVVQPDGRIVVGGYAGFSFTPPHNQHYALARYNADGSLDTGFDGDGKVTTIPGTYTEDVALQGDGKILLAGQGITRYNADGSIDSSFGRGGKALPDGNVRALLLQSDARIIAAEGSGADFGLVRLDARGRQDVSFGGGGVVTDIGPGTDDLPTAAALQPDRRIVVAGSAAVRGQPANFAVARYVNPAPPQCVVPNVRGKTLRIARRTVARGRCAVGRVTRKLSQRVKKGRVISQSRRPGLRLPVGSRVNLVLSKGRPRSR